MRSLSALTIMSLIGWLGGIAVEQWLCNSNVVGSNLAIDNVLVIKYFVVRFSINTKTDAPSHNLFSRWAIR